MSRCYYLEYRSGHWIGTSNDKYICKLCGKEFNRNDKYVESVCNSKCGDAYKDCKVYKSKR